MPITCALLALKPETLAYFQAASDLSGSGLQFYPCFVSIVDIVSSTSFLFLEFKKFLLDILSILMSLNKVSPSM